MSKYFKIKKVANDFKIRTINNISYIGTDDIYAAGCNSANYNNPEIGDWANRSLTTVGTNGGPSAYGTFDQSGNGAEWCSPNVAGGITIVRRGGSWAVGYVGISQIHRADQAPDFVVEIVFYFGQSVPAFCNKIDNLEFTILPKSVWGLQPFIERQLIRVGAIQQDQNKSYQEKLDLSNDTGFFATSWSTTFLDVYFYEGIIFSILFFLMVALLLFFTEMNFKASNSVKFKILTGFNVVFIITFFLSPAFMDTTCFFAYILILFCSNDDIVSD